MVAGPTTDNMNMEHWDVIVVGSGIGGLSAAVGLSNLGKRVLVLEQHYLPGGWTHSFSLEGHKFSPGVHYIGQLHEGGRTREIFEGLGVGGNLEFLELNPDAYDHIVFEDETFDIPAGRQTYIDRLIARFPQERTGIERYFALMQQVDRGLSLAADAKGILDKLKLLFTAPAIVFNGLKPASEVIDRFVTDIKLKAILESRAGDHGEMPSRVPFALHVAIEAHYWNGGWYPKGGAGAIPKAFISRLKSNGGEIRMRTTVDRILLEGSGPARRAVGVQLDDGKEIRATTILSNADAWITYNNLIGQKNLSTKLSARMSQLQPSVSALSLFLATDLDIDALGLDSGNYWILNDPHVDATYAVAHQDELADEGPFPGGFLTVTTRKDPSKMHAGLHTMEAFVFVSYAAFERWQKSATGDRPEEYEAYKAKLTQRMLAMISRIAPGIEDHIKLCELGTPLTNVYYCNGHRGNIYGTAKSKSQIGSGALPVKTEINGLYHCGQSTAAHGVLGAMATGVMAAEQIADCSHADVLAFADDGKITLS